MKRSVFQCGQYFYFIMTVVVVPRRASVGPGSVGWVVEMDSKSILSLFVSFPAPAA